MLDHLNWELSVLSRAVGFANLSGAASQIGISQPQLSRIVSKIESELEVTLLDREAKRKSSWTLEAQKLAEIYTGILTRFRSEIHLLNTNADPKAVHIGTLEGMTECALKLADVLYANPSVETVEVIVGDLDALEERYYKGNLDYVFTSREPGRKKLRRSKTIGYQSLSPHNHDQDHNALVFSSFEYATQLTSLKRQHDKKIFISNSLAVRRHWIDSRGGSGILPSDIYSKQKNKPGELPVLLLASDLLPEKFWDMTAKIKF